jgi:hypothetical protein
MTSLVRLRHHHIAFSANGGAGFACHCLTFVALNSLLSRARKQAAPGTN